MARESSEGRTVNLVDWMRHLMAQPVDEQWQESRLYKLATWVLSFQHLLVIACGLAWFIQPSNTIGVALDGHWSLLWSMMFVAFSLAGLVGRLRHTWPVEATANIIVAISVWVWAMVVLGVTLWDHDYGGLQTSFMLLGFAANLWGWSLIQIAWVKRKEAEGKRFKRLLTEKLAEELTKHEPPTDA